VGGGSGLTAASFAQKDGKRVALVDSKPDALGGTCVNRGCLPTKGMIHAADVLRTIQGAKEFGIEVVRGSVRVDFGAIMERVRAKRKRDAKGVRSWVEDAFTPFFSEARFVDEKILETEDGKRITGDAIFLATGARPAVPPIEGLDEIDYLTNESVIELEEQPKSLIILGAGYIGCEFGHFFSSVGTDVTVIDRSGNGNDGTLFGPTPVGSGVVGQALSFDGVDDYVALDMELSGANSLPSSRVSADSAAFAVPYAAKPGWGKRRLRNTASPLPSRASGHCVSWPSVLACRSWTAASTSR